MVFHLALAVGAPWAAAAPAARTGRAQSLIHVPVYGLLALAIVSAAGFPGLGWPRHSGWTALALQLALTLLHAASRKPIERQLWAPLGAVMTALALVVLSR
ncbi:hypothetical protein Q4543_05450 [Salipiger sp. 1_MG-2023]|uniref:hypothetical protein n=1 Tax=Salipiger sp. 1_MG-2023 TaxID=3062665 RepID=UPI0026E3F3BB|nr:hypothetical protein [Salipiger sp. 1_MG-2023]MDO6584956.1 hypothetical protein [Salipiger sp. 1_MG-2023]